MCKELGLLAQEYGETKGTNTIIFLTLDKIPRIPDDRIVTYARIVVDYRPQKEDPNRVRTTVGGNLINYPFELTTRTADITTSKIMWNLVISTPGVQYFPADVKFLSRHAVRLCGIHANENRTHPPRIHQ